MTKDDDRGDGPRAKKKKASDKAKPKRIVIYLTPQLAKRFRVWCVEHDRSISDLGAELIERHLITS
jgi:hypothetical protein